MGYFTHYSQGFPKSCYRMLRKLLTILVSIFLFFGFIPLMTTFLLTFVVRLTVKYLAKIFRPDLTMMNCAGSACANIDSDVEKPRFAILVRFIFTGTIDVKRLREISKSQVFYLTNPDGSLRYPEMQQYMTSWLGFRFWAQDSDFNLTNHREVVDLGKKVVMEEDLRKLGEKLLVKPFHKHRSPWDVHLVHNVQLNSQSDSNHTAFYFRFSHILGDGFALLKFFVNFCKIEETPKIKTKYPKSTLFENVLFPFKFLYVYAEIIVQFFTKYPFKVPESQKTKDYYIQTSDVVSSQVIKDIKNELGIGFTSTVFGIVAGALREMIVRKGLNVPETFPCYLPFPKPNHPQKLRNHFTLVSLNLPVGEPDPMKRLRSFHKQYEQLKSSAFPVVIDCSIRLSGECFQSLGKLVGQNNFGIVNVSYIPVDWDRCRIDDHELVDFSFCMGVQKGMTGLSVSICSYKNGLVFTLVADKGILSMEDVVDFKQIVKDEVSNLKKLKGFSEV